MTVIGPIDRPTWNTLRKLKSSLETLKKENNRPKRLEVELSTYEYILDNIPKVA